jgi:hypothetical protein
MDQEKVVFTYNGILFNHKKNEILAFAGKWMELENIILSEVIQVQKAKGHIFSLMEYRPNTNINNVLKNRSGQGKVTYKGGWVK